jgi:hypothetical protein
MEEYDNTTKELKKLEQDFFKDDTALSRSIRNTRGEVGLEFKWPTVKAVSLSKKRCFSGGDFFTT